VAVLAGAFTEEDEPELADDEALALDWVVVAVPEEDEAELTVPLLGALLADADADADPLWEAVAEVMLPETSEETTEVAFDNRESKLIPSVRSKL